MDKPEKATTRSTAKGPLSEEKRLTYRLLIRTVLAISMVVIIILVAGGWVIHRQRFSKNLFEMQEDVNSIQEAFESIMLDSAEAKRNRAEGFIVGEGKEHDFHYLAVFSVDTQIVFSQNQADLFRKLDLRQEEICKDCHADTKVLEAGEYIYRGDNDERVYHFVQPIKNREECRRCHDNGEPLRGTMIVDFSLAQLDADILTSSQELVISVIIMTVFFVIFVYFLLWTITYKPLEFIAGRLKRIAEGDFTVLSRRPGQNIIGYINEQIDRTARQLGELYENMESKVKERTASLRVSQEELVEEKNKLMFIFDHSPQGLLEMTVDGTILFANPKAEEFIGTNREDLIGRSASEFELLSKIFEGGIVQGTLDKNRISLGTEQVYSTKDKLKYFEVQASLSTNVEGKKILLLMLADISEKKKVEENLERHERLASIGQLAAGVAHEVGNPLSAISSLVQITQKVDEPDKLEYNLNLINYHIERIGKIVRNLSDFARPPEEKTISANICDIVKGAVEIVSLDNRAKTVQIDLTCEERDIVLPVRRDQLMQAILNVALNALDSMENVSSPVLKICLKAANSGCSISISDNGEGIKEKDRKRIFQPFFTTKPVGKGTGLGLSVTYRIITDMGGEIDVDSEVGRGTTFTITLHRKA